VRLDGVPVQAVYDAPSKAFRKDWGGMSVLVPANESAQFEAGAIHRLTEKASREGYAVIVIAKHETTVGTCVTLKLWNPT
jgi:hypothetical protein